MYRSSVTFKLFENMRRELFVGWTESTSRKDATSA